MKTDGQYQSNVLVEKKWDSLINLAPVGVDARAIIVRPADHEKYAKQCGAGHTVQRSARLRIRIRS